MGIVRIDDKRYSYDEYIELLEQSDEKIEFIDGELRMMAGAKNPHIIVRDEVQLALGNRRGRCKVRGADQAVFVESLNRYYYPDITIFCHEQPKYTSSSISQLLNPTLIVEVLSESTESTDRGEKFHAYFRIPEFQEYVLIDSRSIRVDTFFREASNSWSMRSYYRMDDEVEFRSMGVKLPISVIYADVAL